MKVPNELTGLVFISSPVNVASSVATFDWMVAVTLIVTVVKAAIVPSGQVTERTPLPPAEQLPCVG